jgi:hypothetical protein
MTTFFQTQTLTNSNISSSRPTCCVPGCNKPAAHMLGKTHADYPKYRRSAWIAELHPETTESWCCSTCHAKNTARVHGVKSARHLTAKRQGMSVTKYAHRTHPYLWARKSYCENIDGRLGFVCTYTGPTKEQVVNMGLDEDFQGWLQVDHIDGNSENNPEDESNFQTLCACCHSIKTIQNRDYATIGRKRIKELKNSGVFYK